MSTARAERKIPMTPEEREAAFAEIDAIHEELRREEERRDRWPVTRAAVFGAAFGVALSLVAGATVYLAPKAGRAGPDLLAILTLLLSVLSLAMSAWAIRLAAGRPGR